MIGRREVLRSMALLGGAAAVPGLLTGCGEKATEGGRLVSSDVARSDGDPAAVGDAVAALDRLGGRLFPRLATGAPNTVLSPLSVGVALTMAANGAAGRTRSQMLDVLGGGDLTRLDAGLNALTRSLDSRAGPVQRADGSDARLSLAVPNSLWGQRGLSWKEAFLDTLARHFGAGMRLADYVADPEGARAAVNAWTEERTRGRIPELLPTGVVDHRTRLVLVNALYLKAPWEEPFDKADTARAAFHRADGSSTQVDLMSGDVERAGLGRGPGWRAVSLPYAGGSLAMTVVLPDPGRLADVEHALATHGADAFLDAVGPQGVRLEMPRFRFRLHAPLQEPLSALGMPTAFDAERADFSRMTDEARLSLSSVEHEAFLAVDEEGTEAAAATAAVAGATAAPVLVPVRVDRTFLFVIHDTEHGAPLFLGRVDDPST